jgi:cyanate lyase
MIFQGIRPKTVLKKLEKHNIPRATLAAVLGRSDTLVSLFLGGSKGLSYEMQRQLCEALEFFDDVVERSAAPVDFRQADRIVTLWREYKAKLDESAVIKSAAELEEEDQVETS